MKPTYIFALVSLLIAAPKASAMSELDKLRARCAEQDTRLRSLETENARLRGKASDPVSTIAKPQTAVESAKPSAVDGLNYVVRKGDSIELIARKNGCSAEKLAHENGLKADSVIHPGQKLKLVVGLAEKRQVAAPKESKSTETGSMSVAAKSHKLLEGETYSSVARKYGVSVNSLIAANPQASPTKLRGGQMIRIPGVGATDGKRDGTAVAKSKPVTPAEKPAVSSEVASSKSRSNTVSKTESVPAAAHFNSGGKTIPISTEMKSTPVPKPDERAPNLEGGDPSLQTTPSPKSEKKIHAIKIEGEMTYGEFAAKHGTDTGRLNDLNGLDLTQATVLAKGSELYVPAQP